MMVCGYCGSEIELDGEVLHREGCTAPVPYGDEDAPSEDDEPESRGDEARHA